MSYTAAIFARGGSKGVPGKNLKSLNGKPLIAWAIGLAQQLQQAEQIVVSTDCAKITETAINTGAQLLVKRPAALATDTAPEWQAWQHCIQWLNDQAIRPKALIILPCTSPFRTPAYVEKCITAYENTGADVVLSMTPARRHPAYNLVRVSLQQGLDHRHKNAMPIELYDANQTLYTRQSTSPAFDISTAVYVISTDFILAAKSIYEGRVVGVVGDEYTSIDIDTPFDFTVAQALAPIWQAQQAQAK